MTVVRLLVLVGEWSSSYPGYSDGAAGTKPLTLAHDLFDSGGPWSATDFWHAASYGELDFEVEYVTVGQIPGTISRVADPKTGVLGDVNPADRASTIQSALLMANALANDYDGVVCWVNPPSNAGSDGGTGVLFDWQQAGSWGGHGFYCHELGHMLGMDHTVAKNAVGGIDDYGTDTGIMGWTNPTVIASPPGTVAPITAGRAWWGRSVGPLPSAATLWRYRPAFRDGERTHSLPEGWSTLGAGERTSTLSSHTDLPAAGAVLLAIPTGHGHHTVEWRRRRGWDGGRPEQLLIHRERQAYPRAGRMELVGQLAAEAGRTWASPDADLVITVLEVDATASTPRVRVQASSRAAAPAWADFDIQHQTIPNPFSHHLSEVTLSPGGCREAVYVCTTFEQETRLVCTPAMGGLDVPDTLTWSLNQVAIDKPGRYTFPVLASHPTPLGATSSTVAAVDVTFANGSLLINVPAAAGNFTLVLELAVVDITGRSASSAQPIDVEGLVLQFEDRYFSDLGECIKERYPNVAVIYPKDKIFWQPALELTPERSFSGGGLIEHWDRRRDALRAWAEAASPVLNVDGPAADGQLLSEWVAPELRTIDE